MRIISRLGIFVVYCDHTNTSVVGLEFYLYSVVELELYLEKIRIQAYLVWLEVHFYADSENDMPQVEIVEQMASFAKNG